MNYINRIVEAELTSMLSASGAVLLKGPKSCGKTATAKQFSNSILEIGLDEKPSTKFNFSGGDAP